MKRVLLSALIIAAQAGLAFNTQAAAEKPETVNIGFQKANIFALLNIAARWIRNLRSRGLRFTGLSSRPGRRCWKA